MAHLELLVLASAVLVALLSSGLLIYKMKGSPLIEVKFLSIAYIFLSLGFISFFPTALSEPSPVKVVLEDSTVAYRIGLLFIHIWGLIWCLGVSLPSLKEDVQSIIKLVTIFGVFTVSSVYNLMTADVISVSGLIFMEYEPLGVVLLVTSLFLVIYFVSDRLLYMNQLLGQSRLFKYLLLLLIDGLLTIAVLSINLLSSRPVFPLFSAVLSGSIATLVMSLTIVLNEPEFFGTGTRLYAIYISDVTKMEVLYSINFQKELPSEKLLVDVFNSLQKTLKEIISSQGEIKEIHWGDKVVLFEVQDELLVMFMVSQKNWIVISLLHYVANAISKGTFNIRNGASSSNQMKIDEVIERITRYFMK